MPKLSMGKPFKDNPNPLEGVFGGGGSLGIQGRNYNPQQVITKMKGKSVPDQASSKSSKLLKNKVDIYHSTRGRISL